MPLEIIMPKVDMDMSSGRVLAWHAVEGDIVAKGDPLFDIETDKAAMEVESPGAGVLRRPVAIGSVVPIGQPVALLQAEGEDDVAAAPEDELPEQDPGQELGAVDAAVSRKPEPEPADQPYGDAASPTAPASGHDRTRATPLARMLARNAGMDIGGIRGTGPRNRVQAPDVRAFLEAMSPTPDPGYAPGRGAPGPTGIPVVFIHGFASDTPSWTLVESQIADLTRMHIELPGHGKSPGQRIQDFGHLASIILDAFDALRLEAAHLVGHDLGGALALAIADVRPQSIAGLTLLAPAGLGPEIRGDAIHGVARATRVDSLGPWLRKFVAREDLFSESYVRLVMTSRADADMRSAQQRMADALFPDGVQAFDLRAELTRVRTPTRILWGKSDNIIPWDHALRAPGHVALHLFDGIGHLPQIEAPAIVGSIIASQTGA